MSKRTPWMLTLALIGLALAACGPKQSLFLDAGRGEAGDQKAQKAPPAKTQPASKTAP